MKVFRVLVLGLSVAAFGCDDDECPDGQIDCGGACINPDTDPDYCGASGECTGSSAGVECTATQMCMSGVCSNVVGVTVDPGTQDGTLNERYIGYAFDTAQLSAGKWWCIGCLDRAVAPTPDLENAKLRRLVSQIAPSVVRIGGTDCDGVYFCPEPGECELPASYETVFLDRENREEGVLTHEDVSRTAQFADAVDSDILFCLNYGTGPRDPTTGEWNPDNARALMQFAKSLPEADRFTMWEPGNELNIINTHFDTHSWILGASLFADGMETLRDLVDTESPGAIIPAPGSFILPAAEAPELTEPLMELVEERDPSLVDVVSWHLYATQSDSCKDFCFYDTTLENLMSEELNELHRARAREIAAVAGGRPVWNTESASGQSGGQIDVSDSMADALWYMDWFGILAEEGTELVIRHSLINADYSLIEPDFTPRPTFLALVMMRRLVHEAHLDTDVDREQMKAHGYCSARTPGAVAVVLVNPLDELQVGEVAFTGTAVQSAELWTLSADTVVDSNVSTINGEEPLADGTIPDPDPVQVTIENGVANVPLAPHSVAFVDMVLIDASTVCSE